MTAQIYHLSWTVSKRDASQTIRSVWQVDSNGNLCQTKFDYVDTPGAIFFRAMVDKIKLVPRGGPLPPAR